MIGRTISHYKIIEKLGEGAAGAIYKARDEKLARFVSLKSLPPQFAASRDNTKRFLEEAGAANALNHPSVANVFGIEVSPEATYIVQEYVDGRPLREIMTELSIDEITRITAAVCRGLAAAHTAGIVHHDIRPENIIALDGGRVKIMDFGVARLRGPAVTKAAERIGSPAYASPEQIQGGEVDQRTDLWSLGVMLYELLAGRVPFDGEGNAAIVYEILNGEPRAIESFRSGVPEHLRVLLTDLLQKDPDRRIRTADEVIQRLTQPAAKDGPEKKERAIAVLYFENMSGERVDQYLCAGLAADFISSLSKIKMLRVVPKSEVLRFRSQERSTREIGEAVGVDYVLEGSVRRSGEKIRIFTRLVEVRSGFPMWEERFDRIVDDIFELQREVAEKVASSLKVSLTDSERRDLVRRPTSDPRAYDFYMRAGEHLLRRGRNDALLAIQMLENSLEIDPNFAAAHSALAEAFLSMYTYYESDDKWLVRITEASKKALSLDPNLIDAKYNLGLVFFHNKEYSKSKEVLEEVVSRRPHHYDAYRWLGIISDITGDLGAAIEYYKLSAAIKPYSVEPWLHLNMTYRRKGDLEAAMSSAKRFLEVGLRTLELTPNDAVTLSRFAVIYTLFGEREKAHSTLRQILALKPDDGLVLYNCAATYALLEDEELALNCLRMAFESGYKNIREWVKSDPDFDALRTKKVFKKLVEQFAR